MKKNFLIGLLVFLLFILSCDIQKKKELGRNELARVNETSISIDEFHQILESQPLEGKLRLLNEQGMRDFLENYIITRELLYQEAKRKGLDKKKEILIKIEDFKRAMLIDALLEEELKGKSEVSEEEIRKYYEENKALFIEPLEVKIRQIFVNSELILREVLAKLSQGESFEKIASTYNIGRFKEDGGNLGYIRRGQLARSFSQFEEAAFSLKNKGDISDVIRTPYGFHIIKLEDMRGSHLRPLDQVKDKIRITLEPKKKQEAYLRYIKDLKSKANILINEKLWAEEEKKEIRPKEEKK
jgi:peptidyl-prolyl cis-trans isomerase C